MSAFVGAFLGSAFGMIVIFIFAAVIAGEGKK
jgi:hypothetical protein